MKINPRYIPALIQAKRHKPLSAICSKLHALAREEAAGFEDIYAYSAPSEVAALMSDKLQRRARAAIAQSGFLCPEVLAGVIALRTSEKWLHFSSVSRWLESDY